ncbi:sensor histidine kinase [Nitrosopumilus sp. b3]|uniref:sensor histidine kinase n=1 Tax=Nitrosopumilus sp. b3 TaxID=2109909 RepID=UPI0021055294|nr:sensor histidine kinase [Nitrosopumilus sp. b3]
MLIIAVMFAISLTFTITGMVSFDLTVQESKELLGSRNEGFAFNLIQNLDRHIENRLIDFQELTKTELIRTTLTESNKEFERIENIKAYLQLKEQEIEFTENNPFIGGISDVALTRDLLETIEFYQDEYGYEVVEELFVTNAYGANVALATGTSDYSQSDEEWWQQTKETGKYVGEIKFDENYQNYSIEFAYSIFDDDENFIGILKLLVTLDVLLNDFVQETDLLTISGRDVLLLNNDGTQIFANQEISLNNSPVFFFPTIQKGNDVGFFELDDEIDDFRLISYAQSTGYRTFEGFGWFVVIEQNSSSIVNEFVGLRNSIIGVSILGMIASIIGGFLISSNVSSPLKQLAIIADSISKGDFKIKTKSSKIDEINTIGKSFDDMAKNLQKLIKTEKELAEANVRIKNERLAAIGEVSASMAHNIKNPLATVKSSAEILQKNSEHDDELNGVIERMNRSIDTISHQINDVLNYVRVTPLDVKLISITELMQSAKNSIEIPENISFEISQSDLKINADVEKLEIVLINIFLNAIQAIGKDPGSISCTVEQKNSTAIIKIQNSGPDIPEDVLSHIFQPLVTSKQKGTGLGLSTCKNIIEQHKGTITVQNNPTCFIITLPLSSN